jgi:hypothetical protein
MNTHLLHLLGNIENAGTSSEEPKWRQRDENQQMQKIPKQTTERNKMTRNQWETEWSGREIPRAGLVASLERSTFSEGIDRRSACDPADPWADVNQFLGERGVLWSKFRNTGGSDTGLKLPQTKFQCQFHFRSNDRWKGICHSKSHRPKQCQQFSHEYAARLFDS